MKNILEVLFLKLSYNTRLRSVAKKLFVYFPGLKSQLMHLIDGSDTAINKDRSKYKSDFLDTIKKEIEDKKRKGSSDDDIH